MPDSNTPQYPYNSIFDHFHVSSSQDLSVGPHTHHSPSPASADSPPHFNSITMVSLTDSQDIVPQDVFHTPPENSLPPSSCDQPWTATDGRDPSTVNHAVDVDAGTQEFVDLCGRSEFVDLGRDSELGFSQVQLTQEMGVHECSHGARRDVLGEIRDGRFEESAVCDWELSDLGESRVKKPKLWEVDLGVDSSGACVEVQSQKVEEGVGNCEGNVISEAEKCSAESVETLDGNVSLCESEKVACTVEGRKSSDGVVEGSGMGKKSGEERVVRVLPPSLRGPLKIAASESESLKIAASESESLKNAVSGVEFGNSGEKKNVFDVLRVLSDISNEKEENLDNISLLEVAEACGITFPRPRWWPEGENFDP